MPLLPIGFPLLSTAAIDVAAHGVHAVGVHAISLLIRSASMPLYPPSHAI